ncbi:MAG: hypothetical protein WB019_24095, partial [Pseudolabrys sp.]
MADFSVGAAAGNASDRASQQPYSERRDARHDRVSPRPQNGSDRASSTRRSIFLLKGVNAKLRACGLSASRMHAIGVGLHLLDV